MHETSDICLLNCDEHFVMNIEAEIEWKRSLPKFDFKFLKETFTEAKDIYIQKLEEEITNAEKTKEQAKIYQAKIDEFILLKIPTEDEEFYRTIFYGIFIGDDNEKSDKTIKRNNSYIDILLNKRKTKGGVNQVDIDRAREYPIDTMIDFRRGVANCLWHNDHKPSLHYYEKDNHVYCFSCNKAADAIDVYRQLNEVDFISAVKALQ